jgi:tetratricopeptide (TPR) repeat protein
MVFVADDLGAWLIGLLADGSRKRLTDVMLGSDQQRALRRAARTAIQLTAKELRPDGEGSDQLAMVVSEIFSASVPDVPVTGQTTLLEALQAGIAGQLAPLDDPRLTGTWKSSLELLGVPAAPLAKKLTSHLVREIVVRGARGGPLATLAAQLNSDKAHLQGQRIEDILGRLDNEVRKALALLDTMHSMAAAPIALAQLPNVIAGFTGREGELAVLTSLLDPTAASQPVVVSAVAGLAGVGKTTLAVEAGHAVMERGWFPGGVLFIDLHGYDDQRVEPGQALDALLRALSVRAENIPPGVEERAGLYRSMLAKVSDPVLVIADNASSEAQVRPLLPGAGPHRVVVTSRHTLAGLEARLLDVTKLDYDASEELLDRALRAARPDDDRIGSNREAAGQLAQICGGLPLALQIVAALLKSGPANPISEMADDLAAEHTRLERLRYGDGAGLDTMSVAAAFELSYRRLDAASARAFRLLPLNPGPDVSTAAVAVLTDLAPRQARDLLAGLARAHLIEPAPGVVGRWRMHDLLRLYALRLSDENADADDRESARNRLLDYYLRMTEAAEAHLTALPGMALPVEFTDRDQALAWLDAEQSTLTAAVALAASVGRDQVAMLLPTHMSAYLQLRRRLDDRLATGMLSLDAARRLGDQANEAAALANLADPLQEVGRFEEAITACQDAAAFFRRVGDRYHEGGVLNNLGVALRGAGRYKEAITACLEAAAICQEFKDSRGASCALNNLGLAFIKAGRLDDAIDALQMELELCRITGDVHGQGLALGNLGNVLLDAKRFEEAITASQDAAALCQQVGDQYGQGIALGHLALALHEAQRFEEAATAHQDAALIYRGTGDQHREGLALNSLSLALQEAQRFDEAVAASNAAAAVFHQTGERALESLALSNLSNALLGSERFDEAITAAQNAVGVSQHIGYRHREGRAQFILANAYRAAERFDEAIATYQAAAITQLETGDQSGEAETENNLGVVLQLGGWFDDAIIVYQAAATNFRETGDRHREAIHYSSDIAKSVCIVALSNLRHGRARGGLAQCAHGL